MSAILVRIKIPSKTVIHDRTLRRTKPVPVQSCVSADLEETDVPHFISVISKQDQPVQVHSFIMFFSGDCSNGVPKYVARRWKIKDKLGSGGFGSVYKADGKTGKSVAVKFEKPVDGSSYLFREFEVFSALERKDDVVGLPEYYYYGGEGEYDVIVMERLGSSLYNLRSEQGGSLSTKSIHMIGIQALKRIETLHSAGSTAISRR